MINKLRDFFSRKKVLILGFGREGKSTFSLLNQFDCEIAIADKNLEITDEINNLTLYAGDDYLACVDSYDVIMKTPGIALFDSISLETRAKITSQTDLFLRFCKNTVIGITGTKGKSTTSSLCEHILRKCGKNTILIGNIGIPPLNVANLLEEDTIVVCEVSCHQLEYVKASPKIAVLLNVYEEHLDHYVDFYAYKAAKENIYRFQNNGDTLIYNARCYNAEIAKLDSKKISVSETSISDIFFDDDGLCFFDKKIPSSLIKTNLEGKHNLYNLAVAAACAVEVGCDLQEAISAAADFNGLEHRMETVRILNGVKYVNDSISTIPLATIGAVQSFNADTVIIGGMDRGINYDLLVNFLNAGAVENVICLPDSGIRIAKMLNLNVAKIFIVKDMEEAVKIAHQQTKRCCVLSPAAASYGFYKNFEERGKHFKALVNKL